MTTPNPRADRPTPGGRPVSLPDLIQALEELDWMGPIERARAIPDLIEAAKGVLSRERVAAMAEATAPGPQGISRAELARQLGISPAKVSEVLKRQ